MMTHKNIDKWIKGEIDVFFDPHPAHPSVIDDSNPGLERMIARPVIQTYAYPLIAAVVGVVIAVVLAGLVISMRHSVVPLPATDAKSRPSEGEASSRPVASLPGVDAESQTSDARATFKGLSVVGDAGWSTPVIPPPRQIIPTLATPVSKQPTTTLSDAQLAAFLQEVGLWYDQQMKATPGAE